VVFYDGPTFDNDPTSVYPGEWNNGVGLTCPAPGAFDVTAMTPLENTTPNMPVTGFSSRWKIVYDNSGTGGCKPGVTKANPALCIPPTAGTNVHLVFSHTSANATVKRPDGTPIPDDNRLIVTIPAGP
jgi:hypothetical protein